MLSRPDLANSLGGVSGIVSVVVMVLGYINAINKEDVETIKAEATKFATTYNTLPSALAKGLAVTVDDILVSRLKELGFRSVTPEILSDLADYMTASGQTELTTEVLVDYVNTRASAEAGDAHKAPAG